MKLTKKFIILICKLNSTKILGMLLPNIKAQNIMLIQEYQHYYVIMCMKHFQ